MQHTVAIRKSKKREVITSLLQHFIELLKLDRSHVHVTVFSVVGYAKEHGAYGGINVDGKHVTIALDSALSRFQTILVLAHEMIHVKQVARGQLSYVNEQAHWMGRNLHHLPYDDRPWEIQAHAQMTTLIGALWDRISDQVA